ncbi:MAG: 30S ribosomal protein S4 [Bacteroidales bacterium]|nr:30S ribosomal protein S4 [Bacteroidales bacterium]
MARYTGSTSKVARRFGEPIYGPDSALQKKNYAPGQHGPSKRRGKKTEYGVQLQEKQKAKYTYGVLERQFENLFALAETKPGITGENLIQLLEQRLDNVVFRMGIAPSRRSARQLVNHGHIMVNGQVVNIPSYSVKPGMVIAVRPKSKSLEVITSSLSTNSVSKFAWLEFDKSEMQGKFLNVPDRQDVPENIKEQLIVELYSKQ